VAESLNEVDPLSGEKQLKDFTVSFEATTASFVKVVAQNLGRCPKGHSGEGKPSWMGIDEIAVE
jgi:hexosaminidase